MMALSTKGHELCVMIMRSEHDIVLRKGPVRTSGGKFGKNVNIAIYYEDGELYCEFFYRDFAQ